MCSRHLAAISSCVRVPLQVVQVRDDGLVTLTGTTSDDGSRTTVTNL